MSFFSFSKVHRFLEDVVRTQRVVSLDAFHIGPHTSFSVTAFPLFPDMVAVVMDPPKNSPTTSSATSSSISSSNNSASMKEKDREWVSLVTASGTAVAVCDGAHVLHANENFAGLLAVPHAYVSGRDIFSVLEMRARSTSRPSIAELRRAVSEGCVGEAEIELEHFACRVSVHPMGEHVRQALVIAHRTRAIAPVVPQRPTFPIFPSSFPSSTPDSAKLPYSASDTTLFKDAIDSIPCGIMLLRKEDEQFRVVSLNRAARALPFTKNLLRFDESTSPFDITFVRALHSVLKSQEGRVAYSMEGGKLGARVVPYHDVSSVAVLFEESTLFEFPSHIHSAKRAITDLEVDRGYQVFPNHPSKYMRPHSSTPTKSEERLPFSSTSLAPILPPLLSSPSPTASPSPFRSEKLERVFHQCVVGMFHRRDDGVSSH